MPARHLTLGQQGEKVAADFLKKKGYKIVERNWRSRDGELDIICRKGRVIVFAEVKTRTPGPMNRPHYGMTAAKQRRLTRAAQQWLSANDKWSHSCRFDLVAVELSDTSEPAIEHTQNAFSLSADSGWQPW